MLNVRKVAEGTVAEAFTPRSLTETYGGRLGLHQITELGLGAAG